MSRLLMAVAFTLVFCLDVSPALALRPTGAPPVVRSPLDGLRDLGRAPATLPVTLAIAFKYRNEPELDRLIELQSTPGSPLFGHFLSSRQFDDVFGPSPRDYARTLAVLRASGFTIVQTYENRTLIDVSAPAAVVERYFTTELHRVVQPGFGLRTVAAREPRLPEVLRPTVDIVDGFNSVVIARPFVRANPVSATEPHISPLTGPITYLGSYGPNATSIGYDFPVRHGHDGHGHGTANVICGDFRDADLKGFLATFKITRTGPASTRVAVDGGAPYFPPNNDPQNCSIESSLDVQTIVGNAPGTKFYEYLIPDLSDVSIEDAYNKAISQNKVDVVNSSFGGCETDFPAFGKTTDKIVKQGAVKGITFDASSGDGGSAVCSPKGVSSPASGPHFVAIGGTSLNVNGKTGAYIGETGWAGSGGGVSVEFAEPAYQKLISGPLPSGRNVPDIALAAVNVAIFDGGQVFGADGTSWAAPLYAALQTEINEVKAERAGQANTAFYTLAASAHPALYFHDITKGSNGAYHAKPGYDNVTGIGSVKGNALATAFP